SLADWPSKAPWHSLILTLRVIDMAKASKVVEAVTHADKNTIWTQTEKDGVRYFSMPSPATLVAITPTIALSNRILIAGFDPVSIEQAIKRDSSGSSELSNSQTCQTAAESVGPITLDQSAIGLAILSGVGAAARQKASASLTDWGSSTASPQPSLSPPSTPNPAPTP